MPSHIFEPEVTPIEGEPNRYFVASSRTNVPDHLVDLEEFEGRGQCSCEFHQYRILPKLEEAQSHGTHIPMLRCRHVNAALKFRHLARIAAEKEKVAA